MKSREEETDAHLAGEFGEDRAERELYEIAISLGRIVDMLAELMKALETE